MRLNKSITPKVALIYDRVNTPYGGAEHVLKAISDVFPHAPVFTSVYSENKAAWADNLKIKTSFLQKIKFLRNKHQLIAFLMPMAFESLNLESFDIVISITSAEAKGILTKPNQLHVCYMLTPTRYLYSHKAKYLASKRILSLPIIKQLANMMLNYLKWWDMAASNRPDKIIPISNLVKERIKNYYNLNSGKAIYPPVNLEIRKNAKKKNLDPYYLSISRLVDYKRVDLSIEAALELNKTLVVAGSGTQEKALKKIAGNNWIERENNESIESLLSRAKKQSTLTGINRNIVFTKKISDEEVNFLLTNCKALLMPGEEDFGITGLEASIFGKPVIVFYRSGVSELLENEVDSVFMRKEAKKELIKAIQELEKINFDTGLIKSKAKHHDTEKFKKQFEKEILGSWEKFSLNN